MIVEKAVRTKNRELPEWVKNAFAKEMAEARAIVDPCERRAAEVAIELKMDRLSEEMRGGE